MTGITVVPPQWNILPNIEDMQDEVEKRDKHKEGSLGKNERIEYDLCE